MISGFKSSSSENEIPKEMRAVVLDGAGWDHLSIKRVPVPHPTAFELLARVDCAGICTSLLKIIDQGPAHPLMYGQDLARYPAILGDEGSITLVQIGEAFSNQYKCGERYVLQPSVDHAPIYNLERYKNGGIGIEKIGAGYTLPGHLAEYMLIAEEELAAGCLIKVSDNPMPYAHAALTEPLSCCVSAHDHHIHLSRTGPQEPRTVEKGIKNDGVMVVIGAGIMGRMHVDVGLSCHPRAIVVNDLIPDRLKVVENLFGSRAKQTGITLRLVQTGQEDLNQVVAELTNGHGADDVIVAVGVADAIILAQSLVGRGGVLDLFGGLPRGKELVPFDALAIHYREMNVTGSSGGFPWDMLHTLELISSGNIEPSTHITRIGDLEHTPELLTMVKNQTIDGKAVVYPHRRSEEIMTVDQWTSEDEKSYLTGSGERT